MKKEPLLKIQNLSVDFKTDDGIVHAVKNVSFEIPKGETVGLVGESGSGKSVTSLAIMKLLPSSVGVAQNGNILFQEENLTQFSEKQMRSVRGNKISMIFQEPMTSLNPVFTVGDQIIEALQLHRPMSRAEAHEKTLELLDQVGIPNPSQRARSYPHEMSGGQRQRVMIAMAIACEPDLLIADEPTTALDVTIQKQILDLLADLQKKYGMSILFITHDLTVVGDIADRVVVMYGGDVVETGSTKDIFSNPQAPYTKGLLACRPSLESNPKRLPTVEDFLTGSSAPKDSTNNAPNSPKTLDTEETPVLVKVENLKTHFPLEKNFFGRPTSWVKAVDGVSFQVRKGETLGLVGESGCGKTTLGRSLLRLIEPSEGEIFYRGGNLLSLNRVEMQKMRRKIQIIFQDPYASLNPRMTVGSILTEPMKIHKIGDNKTDRVGLAAQLLKRVGLPPESLNRYPHEFSGGQRQRICIARALSVKPEFIVCDESVSALDVSVQAQILNLLLDLQEDLGLTYIFISHDLSVVKFISDRVAVMNGGKFVEVSHSDEIYNNPKNNYTQKLLACIPKGTLKRQ